MRIEFINGITRITAENNKCLVRKDTEQTIADNNIESIYLAKSLSPNDFEERDKIKEIDNGN